MKLTITILFCCILKFSLAQNLVLNPSFESYKYCPEYISNFDKNVTFWSTPTFATTDYFNTCTDRMRLINHAGSQRPRTGDGYVGLYTFSENNYREYIQGELQEELEEGKIYKLSFYISLAEYSTHAVSNLDILFMSIPLNSTTGNQINLKQLSKQDLSSNYLPITNDAFYTDKTNWIKVEVDYVALGFEKYFTIGNFSSNRKIKKLKVLSSSGKQFSYYYIDDVSIEPLEKDVPKEKEIELPVFEKEIIYTFKNVLFDFDKSELLEVSIEELNRLYKYLSENLNVNIEIYGHTDAVGLDSRNKELSEQRAKAVADYLISQGLNTSKIKSFGFGSSKPVSDNETEEGQHRNRRVEFKIIPN